MDCEELDCMTCQKLAKVEKSDKNVIGSWQTHESDSMANKQNKKNMENKW
jgi:hypothetical protein